MPYHTISYFFTYCDSKSVLTQMIIENIHYQVFIGIGFSMAINIQKFDIFSNSSKHDMSLL